MTWIITSTCTCTHTHTQTHTHSKRRRAGVMMAQPLKARLTTKKHKIMIRIKCNKMKERRE